LAWKSIYLEIPGLPTYKKVFKLAVCYFAIAA